MAGSNEQAWVTSAVCEKDVEAALITCYSLRRTCTTRKVVVIASHNLSSNSRQAFIHGFDFVFYLEEDFNFAHLELEDFAKLYLFLALQSFDKCAFVSPFMLAVKNCDDIFSVETDFIAMDKNAFVFVFKPSSDNCNTIVQGLKNLTLNSFENGFNFGNWLQNHFKEGIELDEKYYVPMDKEEPLIGYKNDLCMFSMKNFPTQCDANGLTDAGLLGGLIATHWSEIRNNNVLPLINHSTGLCVEENSLKLLNKHNEPIAIVGMSCRYTGSNNLEEFWNLLFKGEDGTGNPPPFKWSREHETDSRKVNTGFLKTPVDEFDAKLFGIPPKEAVFMDPVQGFDPGWKSGI